MEQAVTLSVKNRAHRMVQFTVSKKIFSPLTLHFPHRKTGFQVFSSDGLPYPPVPGCVKRGGHFHHPVNLLWQRNKNRQRHPPWSLPATTISIRVFWATCESAAGDCLVIVPSGCSSSCSSSYVILPISAYSCSEGFGVLQVNLPSSPGRSPAFLAPHDSRTG
jgi:hypothetical protein